MIPALLGLKGAALAKVIALVCFVVFFLIIVVRLVLAGPKKYRDASRIPLEDDVVTPRKKPKTPREPKGNEDD